MLTYVMFQKVYLDVRRGKVAFFETEEYITLTQLIHLKVIVAEYICKARKFLLCIKFYVKSIQ